MGREDPRRLPLVRMGVDLLLDELTQDLAHLLVLTCVQHVINLSLPCTSSNTSFQVLPRVIGPATGSVIDRDAQRSHPERVQGS